jgi:hypothetical protein
MRQEQLGALAGQRKIVLAYLDRVVLETSYSDDLGACKQIADYDLRGDCLIEVPATGIKRLLTEDEPSS